MHSDGLSPEPEDSLNYRMGSAVSSTYDLEGGEIYGVGVLAGGIESIVHTGLPEVDLGDILLLVRNGVVTPCVVDRIGQPEACQVVAVELTFFFSKEELGDMVPEEGLKPGACYIIPLVPAFSPYMVVMGNGGGGAWLLDFYYVCAR